MINVNIKVNFDDIIDDVNDLFKKQIPYTAFQSLNQTAWQLSVKSRRMMPYFIEGGPVGFTARGVQYEKAKSKHNLTAYVFIPLKQWRYMQWVVEGGVKTGIGSKHGISKPIFANTKFNKYGNIPGKKRKESVWRPILRDIKAEQSGLGSNQYITKSKRGNGYVLWQRYGGKKIKNRHTRMLMVFNHDPVRYNKGKFPFFKIINTFAPIKFGENFNINLVKMANKYSNIKVI